MAVICRPELHGATTREQYDTFHAGMEELGLERTITRDGKVFHLPTGEYLGVNVTQFPRTLALKINVLAIRVTGHECKLTITPVSDPSEIIIFGLVEDTSYRSTFGALGLHPLPFPMPSFPRPANFVPVGPPSSRPSSLPPLSFFSERK